MLLADIRSAMDEVNQLDERTAPEGRAAAVRRLDQCRSQLFDAVYAELRAVATRVRKANGPLGATSLVHQAYTRLVRNDWALDAPDDQEFFQRAGRVLQQTLIDHARKSQAAKAGGGQRRISLDDRIHQLESSLNGSSLMDLDEALMQLEKDDATAASIVRLHFFGSLTFVEIAAALDMSERSVYRKWNDTRGTLFYMLNSE